MKICVYAICLNEIHHIDRFYEAAKDADLIVIADTGSTDGTAERARELGIVVHDIRISPWRFDDARNAALALLPPDIDVCFSLDLDEVLQPGWREEVERVWTPGETNRLSYLFDWGDNGLPFAYDKVHSRQGFRWKHICHERVVPDGRTQEVWARTDKLLVVHKADNTKSRSQYFDLLKADIEEDPYDPHNAFYFSRECGFRGLWQEALTQVERYLALPGATWINERCYAMRTAGRCASELGDWTVARQWFERAAQEAPQTREPWCELSALAYRQEDWKASHAAAIKALEITRREEVYTVDPAVWGFQPHEYACIAAWNLGYHGEAVQHARTALAHEPENERLIANLAACERSYLGIAAE